MHARKNLFNHCIVEQNAPTGPEHLISLMFCDD